jgi:predicted metalloprotease
MSRRTRRQRRAAHRRRLSTLSALALLTVIAVVVSVAGPGSGSAIAESGRFTASVDQSIASIQQFWAKQLPTTYGIGYKAIPDDRLFPYSSSNPPPACDTSGRGTTPYEEVKGNAFYCSQGDFVAYDEETLLPKLRDQFGDFAVALVLAHEWGHAIQARTNSDLGATVYVEMQADCFAGAWTRHIANGGDSSLHLASGDLDTALGGYLVFRDPVGTDGGQSGAHGNAFDRVSAFQDGYHGGASACRDYENDPPAVTETGFTSQEDASSGGNIAEGQVQKLVTDDLTDYWGDELGKDAPAPRVEAYDGRAPSCSGASDGGVLDDGATYCADTNTISYDRASFDNLYSDVGDFGAGMLVAAAWSSAVQHATGQEIGSNTARLRADCLTGAWTGSVASGDRNSDGKHAALSAGDLDEAIQTFTVAGRTDTDTERGSAFTRVAAFRTGFTDGERACRTASV